jgi:hypothetical protein
VQVSRFDKWKDPQGVIDAFRIARKQVDATLVLVGNIATDDPEGQETFASLCQCGEDRIRVLSVQDSALVNALQRRAAVVLQKSIREGFGLTVTEAMWKGTPVIGGREDHPPPQRSGAAPEAWGKGKRDRPPALPDDAADGGLAGPHRVLRAAFPIEGRYRLVTIARGLPKVRECRAGPGAALTLGCIE